MQLYMHGVHQDFLQLNNLSKLEVVAGGSAAAIVKMQGDLEYYKDLFEKYTFSYIEQYTKEKFLRELMEDPPPEITLASNKELEAKNFANKKLLEEKSLIIDKLNRELEATIKTVCKEHQQLEKDVVGVTKMLREMQDMEVEIAALKSVEDKFSVSDAPSGERGMTVQGAEMLLEEQTQSLYEVNQEMEEVEAIIQDLKWKENQTAERNQRLARECAQSEVRAKEAVRLSATRNPDVEAAYKQCLAATKLYQEGIGLHSFRIVDETSMIVLEYKVSQVSTSPTSHGVQKGAQRPNEGESRSIKSSVVIVQFIIRFHPVSGRMLSASVSNAGCDFKDVMQIAKARNDVSFLITEVLGRASKGHS
ncbi:hypothetical protein BG004_000045 [Podila humilis]|nr:hypothetical protein BG004_000045 [Podila humilis]